MAGCLYLQSNRSGDQGCGPGRYGNGHVKASAVPNVEAGGAFYGNLKRYLDTTTCGNTWSYTRGSRHAGSSNPDPNASTQDH